MAPRWRAAWGPKRSRGGARSGSEHGSTLASSVGAEEVAGQGRAVYKNTWLTLTVQTRSLAVKFRPPDLARPLTPGPSPARGEGRKRISVKRVDCAFRPSRPR